MKYVILKTPSGDPANPCITPVPWLDDTPDFTVFTEPSLSVFKKAWTDFVASGAELEIISDPVPLPPPPREIDARRLRLALYQLGYLSKVKAAITALGESALIEWEYATIIREDSPLVTALATGLKLNIDEIFTLAASLP